jgi:hypothetical protein
MINLAFMELFLRADRADSAPGCAGFTPLSKAKEMPVEIGKMAGIWRGFSGWPAL